MHLCDCQEIHPSEIPQRLAVHSISVHVQRRMGMFFAGHELVAVPESGVHVLEAEHFHLLPLLRDLLSVTERVQVRVAPWQNPLQDIWLSESLELWCDRLASPWLQEACKHLNFHFQPIVDLKTGEVTAFEALVRAQLDGKLMGAYPLLQAALAHSQMQAFDALCRSTAIVQGSKKLEGQTGLFINFLPSVIYNPTVCLRTTFQACERTGMDLGRLTFEVVESEAFPNLALLKSILSEYQAAGARVALDDLGGGHTSLLYLSHLQPDLVKLDRGLIQGITPDDPRLKLLSALIQYAHDLGVMVVAEGIEEVQEFSLLRELGADLMQGYLLGKPAPEPQYFRKPELWV